MTLEKLWNECLSEECAVIDTDEEREAMAKAIRMRERVDILLDKAGKAALGDYVDAVYAMEALFVKKAFIKGCKFSVSFLRETGYSEMRTEK